MAKVVDWYYHRNGCTSCSRVSRFLDARHIEIRETTPASRKLGRSEAIGLAASVDEIVVAKGRKLERFRGGQVPADVVLRMLGPTGNLRSPTLRVDRTLVVGFNEETLEHLLG